ncbi:MAG: DUF4397 domain-containing protein [Chitinophagaceae bacterium]
MMKRPLRLSVLMAGMALISAGVLLTACSKNDNGNNGGSDAAGLMAFNLAPDQPAVSLALSGNIITSTPLAFGNYTGVYLGIYPGTRQVQSYDFNTSNPLATTSASFMAGKYYSLFVVGANSNYQNLVIEDELDSLDASTNQAYVRYVNAIPDSSAPVVTFQSGGTEIVNESAAYRHTSAFTAIAPGSLDIAVSNGSNIQASRSITVEANKIYTVLLSGLPGVTDPSAAVQIRYVGNGTLSAGSTQQKSSTAGRQQIP